MEKLINHILRIERKHSFLKVKNPIDCGDDIINNHIIYVINILQRWFSKKFKCNYCITEEFAFDLYILYNKKLYKYDVFFGDNKLCIELIELFILYNSKDYMKIGWYYNNRHCKKKYNYISRNRAFRLFKLFI
jgi:hypothetical protein